ncbi:polyserase-related [Holotrichia oblita]|uniref:Polyserase-related n=1 Tax=Holotrichia oblita TaxID=644536 RepID=A0ACB9TXX7_HOLOL|nr:polyserase-related [Holotrichia oblita]
MMNKFILILAVVGISASCYGNPIERIVNGTNANLGEFPYIVSLRRNSSHSCGGSIVTDRCILTAAHCVYERYLSSLLITKYISTFRDPQDYSIQYGVVRISNDDTNSIDVEEIITHERYLLGDYAYSNDVAVLKLATPIEFGENVRPITLPGQGQAFQEWSDAVLAGWGLPYTGGSVMQDLQKVDILLYSDDACETAHNSMASRLYHVCAGVPEGGKGQCNGDSGGPLTVGGTQVGIVSWSIKPCTIQGYPGVFARAANYVDWILEKCSG